MKRVFFEVRMPMVVNVLGHIMMVCECSEECECEDKARQRTYSEAGLFKGTLEHRDFGTVQVVSARASDFCDIDLSESGRYEVDER